MDTQTKNQIKQLKSDIKASAKRTRELRNEANKLSGMEKWRAQANATDTKQRERLIAYGYLRFHTYNQIEQKCHEAPSAHYIAEFAGVGPVEIQTWLDQGDLRREKPEETPEESPEADRAIAC